MGVAFSRLFFPIKVLLSPEECTEFLAEGKPFLYDLHRIPFNDGTGGQAEPIPGVSNTGMSDYVETRRSVQSGRNWRDIEQAGRRPPRIREAPRLAQGLFTHK